MPLVSGNPSKDVLTSPRHRLRPSNGLQTGERHGGNPAVERVRISSGFNVCEVHEFCEVMAATSESPLGKSCIGHSGGEGTCREERIDPNGTCCGGAGGVTRSTVASYPILRAGHRAASVDGAGRMRGLIRRPLRGTGFPPTLVAPNGGPRHASERSPLPA